MTADNMDAEQRTAFGSLVALLATDGSDKVVWVALESRGEVTLSLEGVKSIQPGDRYFAEIIDRAIGDNIFYDRAFYLVSGIYRNQGQNELPDTSTMRASGGGSRAKLVPVYEVEAQRCYARMRRLEEKFDAAFSDEANDFEVLELDEEAEQPTSSGGDDLDWLALEFELADELIEDDKEPDDAAFSDDASDLELPGPDEESERPVSSGEDDLDLLALEFELANELIEDEKEPEQGKSISDLHVESSKAYRQLAALFEEEDPGPSASSSFNDGADQLRQVAQEAKGLQDRPSPSDTREAFLKVEALSRSNQAPPNPFIPDYQPDRRMRSLKEEPLTFLAARISDHIQGMARDIERCLNADEGRPESKASARLKQLSTEFRKFLTVFEAALSENSAVSENDVKAPMALYSGAMAQAYFERMTTYRHAFEKWANQYAQSGFDKLSEAAKWNGAVVTVLLPKFRHIISENPALQIEIQNKIAHRAFKEHLGHALLSGPAALTQSEILDVKGIGPVSLEAILSELRQTGEMSLPVLSEEISVWAGRKRSSTKEASQIADAEALVERLVKGQMKARSYFEIQNAHGFSSLSLDLAKRRLDAMPDLRPPEYYTL